MSPEEKSELSLALKEITKELKTRRRKGFFKWLFIFLLIFIFANKDKIMEIGDEVAVIPIYGEISVDSLANADDIINHLNNALYNPKTRAVIFDIQSGGGSPVQSAQIYRAIQANKGDIPIYAVIGDVGASGAYYIAAAADKIYADEASIVGSIGVISQQFGYKYLAEKIGLEPRTFTAGEHKDFLSSTKNLQADEVNHMNNLLSNIHQQFIKAVKDGRGNKLVKDEKIFSGLFWTGEEALKLGLIDEIAGISEVINEQFPEYEIRYYENELPFLERLTQSVSLGIGKFLQSQTELKIK